MGNLDLIMISQSEVVDYAKLSKIPLDRLSIYQDSVYLRMVYYQGGFRSHLDIINKLNMGTFLVDPEFSERRDYLSIWNLPGFVGIHLANYLQQFDIKTFVINNFDSEWDTFQEVYERCDPKPLVGISTTFHLNYTEIQRMTKRLKKAFPDIWNGIVRKQGLPDGHKSMDCVEIPQ